MDASVKQNLVRAGAGILFFVLFLVFSVEVHTRRLQEKLQVACESGTESCVRDQIELARWYTPFNDVPRKAGEQAFQRILEGSFSAEQKRELLWELRTSVFGSRNVTRPETTDKKSKLLEEIDTKLAILGPQRIQKTGGEEPVYGFQIAAQICFFSWILFVLLAIWRGMNKSGDILWGPCIRFLGAAVFAFCSWLLCLSLA